MTGIVPNERPTLRVRAPRGSFYPGSRRLQGDLLAVPRSHLTVEQCTFLAEELDRCLSLQVAASGDAEEEFVQLVIAAHSALMQSSDFYFPECAELVRTASGLAVAIPKIPCATDLSRELFERLIRLCTSTAANKVPAAPWLNEIRQQIGKVALPMPAVSHMARAAFELEMPLLEIHGAFLQAGYGSRGVALTGSITEFTPSMSVHLAREKSKANALLAKAGFPIADGGLVRDLADALQRAEALGYPVVIKPSDRDGGLAVSSDIRTPAELERAYATARAESPRVMVEKHIDGTDHRLLIHDDELLVILERTPGGVKGNGTDTVATLLDELNRDPKRGDGPHALLHRIELDDEARDMLRRDGLTLESVPKKDRFVRLRRAANHARGGAVRLVEHVHPDNLDLARRAMRLLRLDIAGLDLILPDITRSWRETGGAICEVNAQPYIGEVIGRDYYKAILEKLAPDGGRIPIVLSVGSPGDEALRQLSQVARLAVVDAKGAWRDGHPLSVEGMPWLMASQAALYDRETTAALLILDPRQPIPPISPADRLASALVLEQPPAGAEALLRRADVVYALVEASPAVAEAGIEHVTVQPAAVLDIITAVLAEN